MAEMATQYGPPAKECLDEMSRMEDQRHAVLAVGLHTWKCGTSIVYFPG
jgi:hypothetical protein